MICIKCGTDVPDGSKFCPHCGAKMVLDQETNTLEEETIQQQKEEKRTGPNENEVSGSTDSSQTTNDGSKGQTGSGANGGENKLTPRIIGIIIAAVVVIAAIIVLIVVLSNNAGGKVSIDLNKYIDITFEGYEGHGEASYNFSEEKFIKDYKGKIKLTDEGENYAPVSNAVQSGEDPAEIIISSVSGSFSQSTELSNGDTITFAWEIDPSLTEYLNVDLKYEDIDKTVGGLISAEEIDVFKDVSVTFSGTSPQGEASVEVDNHEYNLTASMFNLDKSTWLANGDTVTVEISDSTVQRLADDYGVIPSETVKEFTVEGLPFYAADVSDIPEESIKTAWTRVEDNYTETISSEMESSQSVWHHNLRKFVSMNYEGYYFFVNEETGTNTLLFVYDIDAYRSTGENGGADLTIPVHYYWFAYYTDIIIDEDGTWIVPSEYEDLTDMFGEEGATFILESQCSFSTSGRIYSYDVKYTGFQYLDEMTQKIKQALPEYTLVNDTVTEEDHSEPDEETNEDEQIPEENGEPDENPEQDEQTPEENNEQEQQEGD